MNLPFTQNQFMNVFAQYNQELGLFQVLFYLAALVLLPLVLRGEARRAPAYAILGVFWTVTGAGYHLAFFRSINPAALAFGILFILQGAIFFVTAIAVQLQSTESGGSLRLRSWQWSAGIVLTLYALAGYPLVGYLAGHSYPAVPLLGTAPCPTTIFTMGILLMSGKSRKKVLLVIPLLWSVIGSVAAFKLGVVQDYGLLIGGVLTLAALILPEKNMKVAPYWWPLLVLISPVLIPVLAVRYLFFLRGKRTAERENRKRIESASPIDIPEVDYVKITILVEWKSEEGFMGDSGVSYLIRTDRGTLLFDVGYGPENPVFSHNARKIGFTTDDADAIAISHLHMDHMGGLAAARGKEILIPDEIRGMQEKTCFLPSPAKGFGLRSELVSAPRLLAAGAASTGILARSLFFLGWTEEQALVLRLRGRGLVVITGCGHPGLKNILSIVRRMSGEPVCAIAGGLHLPVREGRGDTSGIQFQRLIGTGKPPWESLGEKELSETASLINGEHPGRVLLSGHDSDDYALDYLKEHVQADVETLSAGREYVLSRAGAAYSRMTPA